MRKYILLLAALIFSFWGARGAAYTTKIESQRGEKWWGIQVGRSQPGALSQPFAIKTDAPIPYGYFTTLLLSSNGRYVWSEKPVEVEFNGDSFFVRSNHEKVAVRKGGRNLREAYLVACHKHFPPGGAMPEVEMFTMPIYHIDTEIGYMQNQDRITDYADRLLREGFPPGIILVCDGWSAVPGTYIFDSQYYPDPKRMVSELHAKGFKVMLCVTPYVAASGRVFIENRNGGLLLLGSDGKPLLIECHGGHYACFDLSAAENAGKMRKKLHELKAATGVDGFSFDCRAVQPYVAMMGKKAAQFNNNWTSLCQISSMSEFTPGSPRAATPFVNGVDNAAPMGWPALRQQISDVVAAGLNGNIFCHAPLFSHNADMKSFYGNEIFMLRSLQQSCFMLTAHVGFAPWRLKDKTLYEEAKKVIKLRAELGAYMNEMVVTSSRTAEPLVRNLEYQFPRTGFANSADEFMLGPKYLFISVSDNSGTKLVRLPKGVWIDTEGNRHRGPVVTEMNTSGGRNLIFELETK